VSDHPGRPEHPDLWLLSQAILDMDAQADAGQDALDILGRMIDPASVLYMSVQRGLRAEMMMPGRRVTAQRMAAPWLDGFLVGMMVQQLKAGQAAEAAKVGVDHEREAEDEMRFLSRLVSGANTEGNDPSGRPRLPRMPKCPYCQEPVDHISRCDQDGHGGHHQGCCPKPRTT
jgi:hypothetical protein